MRKLYSIKLLRFTFNVILVFIISYPNITHPQCERGKADCGIEPDDSTPIPFSNKKGIELEENTDRPGSDYHTSILPEPDPNLCLNACLGDHKCKAFTYVKPGIHHDENALCYLKEIIPQPSYNNPCCISGVK